MSPGNLKNSPSSGWLAFYAPPQIVRSPQNGNLPGSTLLAPHVNSFTSSCNSGSRWAREGAGGSKNCPVKLTFPGEPGPQAKHVSVLFVVPKITPGRKRRARPRPDLERPSSPGVSLSSLSCLVAVKLRCEEHPIQGAASCQHVSHFRLNVKWFHCGFSTSPTPALNFSHLLMTLVSKPINFSTTDRRWRLWLVWFLSTPERSLVCYSLSFYLSSE